MLLIKFIFFGLVAFANMVLRPQDSFVDKYEKSSDVVLGYFTEVGPAEANVNLLKRFPKASLKKGKIIIRKSWKGQVKGVLEFYYVDYSQHMINTDDVAMTAVNLRRSSPMIFFLREENGKKVAAYRFGLAVSSSDEKIKTHPLYKGLEAVKSGKSIEEAGKIADEGALIRKEAE